MSFRCAKVDFVMFGQSQDSSPPPVYGLYAIYIYLSIQTRQRYQSHIKSNNCLRLTLWLKWQYVDVRYTAPASKNQVHFSNIHEMTQCTGNKWNDLTLVRWFIFHKTHQQTEDVNEMLRWQCKRETFYSHPLLIREFKNCRVETETFVWWRQKTYFFSPVSLVVTVVPRI